MADCVCAAHVSRRVQSDGCGANRSEALETNPTIPDTSQLTPATLDNVFPSPVDQSEPAIYALLLMKAPYYTNALVKHVTSHNYEIITNPAPSATHTLERRTRTTLFLIL